MPAISVITPASRGVKDLSNLVRDFRNQTLQNFEHLVIYDGKVPPDVQKFMDEHRKDYNLKFCSVPKDPGNMKIAPGTRPRNYGIKIATGDYLVFADDDDRYKSTYLETLYSHMFEPDMISVVQMSCQESRIYRDGKKDRIVLVPEIGMPFPVICHFGTPCFMLPHKWAVEDPWREEPEHDFRFVKRIVEKHRPKVSLSYGLQVDVDGLLIRGLRDWVSIPPFNRG